MNKIEIIGWAASASSIIYLIPQVIKSYRAKSSHSLSLGMFYGMLGTIFLWGLYGWGMKSYPLMVTESLRLFLVSYIIYRIKKTNGV